MKYILPLAVLVMAACAVPQSKKINVTITNSTTRPVELHAASGFLSRSVKLNPGESWSGWIYRDMPFGEVAIRVAELEVPAPATAPLHAEVVVAPK